MHGFYLLENSLLVYGLNKAAEAGVHETASLDQEDRVRYHEGIVEVSIGEVGGAPDAKSITVKLQESDDDTNWEDVSGAEIVLGVDKTVGQIAFQPPKRKRYVKVVATVAFTDGTSPSIPLAIHLRLFAPMRGPVYP